MQITNLNGRIIMQLSENEILVIHQSLNEVSNGLKIEPFVFKIGTRDAVLNTMRKLKDIFEKNEKSQSNIPMNVNVSIHDLILYRNAIKEACSEIDDWEFSIRVVGLPKSFAQEILHTLEIAIRDIGKNK